MKLSLSPKIAVSVLRKFWMGLFLLLICSSAMAAAEELQTGTLNVEINGIKSAAGGMLRVALFHGEQGWPKLMNALQLQQLAVTAGQLRVQFLQLPHGDDYAIEVHHDENANGDFDMRWFPYPRPKEGVGVSNNTFGFGHPAFSDARFSFTGPEKNIRIKMRY